MKNIYILKNNYVLRKVLHKTQKDQREAISYKPKQKSIQHRTIHSSISDKPMQQFVFN